MVPTLKFYLSSLENVLNLEIHQRIKHAKTLFNFMKYTIKFMNTFFLIFTKPFFTLKSVILHFLFLFVTKLQFYFLSEYLS